MTLSVSSNTTTCQTLYSIPETITDKVSTLLKKIASIINYLFHAIVQCTISPTIPLKDMDSTQEATPKPSTATRAGTGPNKTKKNKRQGEGLYIGTSIEREPHMRKITLATKFDLNAETARSTCLGLTPPQSNAIKFDSDITFGDVSILEASESCLRSRLGSGEATQQATQFIDFLTIHVASTQAHTIYKEKKALLRKYLTGEDRQEVISKFCELTPNLAAETNEAKKIRITDELALTTSFSTPLDLTAPDSLVSVKAHVDPDLKHVNIQKVNIHLPGIDFASIIDFVKRYSPEIDQRYMIIPTEQCKQNSDGTISIYLLFPKSGLDVMPLMVAKGETSAKYPHMLEFGLSRTCDEQNETFPAFLTTSFFERHTPSLTAADQLAITEDIIQLANALKLDLDLSTTSRTAMHDTPLLFSIEPDDTGVKFCLNVLLDIDNEMAANFYSNQSLSKHFSEAFGDCSKRLRQHFFIPLPWKLVESENLKITHGSLIMYLRHTTKNLQAVRIDPRGTCFNGKEVELESKLIYMIGDSFSFRPDIIALSVKRIIESAHKRRHLDQEGLDHFWIKVRPLPDCMEFVLMDLRDDTQIRNETDKNYHEDAAKFHEEFGKLSRSATCEYKTFNPKATLTSPDFDYDGTIPIERMICSVRIK